MTTAERKTSDRAAAPKKKAKAADLTPTTESGRIRMLKDMLDTNRTEAEGWRQVAQSRQATIDTQLTLIDQQAGQIESLRRALEDKENFINDLAGVKPKKKHA